MLVHRIKTLLFLILLFLGYGCSLLPLLLVKSYLETEPFYLAIGVWLALGFAVFPFLLRIIIRKVWFFQGKANPVDLKQLQTLILAVDDFNSPVRVRKKRKKIQIGWRCTDPDWCPHMALAGIHKSYELRLRFNPTTHTVIMSDRVRGVNFELCPMRVRTAWLAMPRLYCTLPKKERTGIEVFKKRRADQYSFSPQELKAPFFETIRSEGWNIRMDLF